MIKQRDWNVKRGEEEGRREWERERERKAETETSHVSSPDVDKSGDNRQV